MVWRRKKRRHASGPPPPVDWSRQAAYLPADDPALAELKPELDANTERKQAIRAILYLYWDLATNWCGIDGEGEFGSFDRRRWLRSAGDYDGGVWCTHDDALLLRQGSAVALLCEMDYDWVREEELDEQAWTVALDAGRFDLVPEARRAVEAGLRGPKPMYTDSVSSTTSTSWLLRDARLFATRDGRRGVPGSR